MSFTDSNHFSMSLSFSYWNITADYEGLQSTIFKPNTIQTVQKYKSWWHVLCEMCRLVTLVMLRHPKFYSNFNWSEK